jgi:DNA-binding transcriptional ArsR family regulator
MMGAVRLTKALADAQRLRILMLLRGGELCVCQIVEVLALAPSTVSKHLYLLNQAGLIDARKQGRWAFYRLGSGSDHDAVQPMMAWLEKALGHDETVGQDAVTLKRVLACDPAVLCRKQQKGKTA